MSDYRRVLGFVCDGAIAADSGLRCDQIIRLNSAKGRRCYPNALRRISYAMIHRHRWRIELFFRWIKQHLRLRDFFSTDPNGVRA